MIEIRNKIIEILIECEVEETDIYNENFIKNEILESLQIAEIVMQIEDEFKIEIDGEDIIPDNFTNVKQIEKLITKYKDRKSVQGLGGHLKESDNVGCSSAKC